MDSAFGVDCSTWCLYIRVKEIVDTLFDIDGIEYLGDICGLYLVCVIVDTRVGEYTYESECAG